MDEHTLQVLEYAKIKALVRRHIGTALGAELLEAMLPESDLERVRLLLKQTSEARRAIDQLLEAPLDPVYDLRPLLNKLKPEGAFLDGREMNQVYLTLQTAHRVKEFCTHLPASFEQLKGWGEQIQPLQEIENIIHRTVDDEGQVRDSASRQLKAIRGSIREVQDWITTRLEKMIRRAEVRESLQEPYFTQREGRYVLPVETKYKNRMKGIVHDCSDTGTTTFIEPIEIVEQGNRLRELIGEQDIEVRKILRLVSSHIRHQSEAIRISLEVLGQIDFAYAKGRLSAILGMQEPEVADSGMLRINRGRHPLLLEALREKVVPLDLQLDDRSRIVVLTGPNTGGKTVVLKTVGVLCLMAASGLHIPAGDGTRMVIYDQIFADIGDEQSIEQNLSTFSSHIKQISRFVTQCDSRTLVLLDELGTGTDPVEGGALAAAILSALKDRGAFALVTTHLNELKVFAYETEGADNAAMEFDLDTLAPTYRLLRGTPGSSYALDIASRLGLPEELIRSARSRLADRRQDAEALLEKLSTDARMAELARRTAEDEKEKAERVRLDLVKKLDTLEREKGHLQERSRHEAREKLDQLQKSIREAEAQMEEILQLAREAKEVEEINQAASLLEEIKEKQLALRLQAKKEFQPPPEPPKYEPIAPSQMQPGQMVHLQGFTRPGKLVTVDLKRKLAEVHIQTMQVQVPLNRILGVLQVEEKPRQPASASRVTVDMDRSEEVPHSIDIHGLTQDEAYPLLERFLDRSHLAGWHEVYVIHGLGTGTLRRMVQDLMKKHPLVKSFRSGDYFEGGGGVTVATLHPR
mgnify:CR=1 FL=1